MRFINHLWLEIRCSGQLVPKDVMTILWFVKRSVAFDLVLWCKWLLKRKTMHAALICVFLNSLPGQFQVIYSMFLLRAVADSLSWCRLKLSAQKPQRWLWSVLRIISLGLHTILVFFLAVLNKVSYCISYSISFLYSSESSQNKVVSG